MGIMIEEKQVSNLIRMLDKMDDCSQNMEKIIQLERQAVHSFDGEMIEKLSDDRARCQSDLVELESQCRRLLRQCGAPRHMTLEDFIDIYIDRDKASLQRKRLQLLERVERVQQATDGNRIRLHAAWHVTTNVLKEIGVLQIKEGYGQDGYTFGVMR